MNLFYGLSQAGRAIAAGCPLLGRGTGQQWQATGHGLKFDVAVPAGFSPRRSNKTAGHLFSRASIATGSPLDFSAVEFGALINQLVDYTMVFPETEGYPRPIHDVHVYAPPQAYPLELEVRAPPLPRGNATTPAEVRELLRPYPALRNLPIVEDEDGHVRWSHNEGRCFVVIENADGLVSRGVASSVWDLKGYTDYRRSAVLLPTSGDSGEPLRPLMSWWGVLYALSMLARYAPSTWTEALSLSESAIASRVEFLLDAAVEAVPELLWSELFALQELQSEL